MITTIIFDFFGVFRTDSYKTWLAKNNFKRTGVFSEASILSDEGKISVDEFYRRISEAANRVVTQDEVDATSSLDKEMVAFARELRKQYKTSLLSNAPADFVNQLLHKYELRDIFDTIFISGETGLIKPHADAFQHTLDSIGSTPEETLFIDDNPENVESAQKLGINAIVFTSVSQLKDDLKSKNIDF